LSHSLTIRSCVSFAALSALYCASANATGFFINQQSVSGLGRVDAGNVAAADDLGTLFFNPAGVTRLWQESDGARSRASVGLHLIVPRSDLTNAGSTATTPGTLGSAAPLGGGNGEDPSDPTPVLNAYYARRLANERVFLGARFNVPFGLAADYDADWFGRYDTIEAELATASFGGIVGFRIDDRLSVGGGLDIQYADSTLVSAIPNPLVPGGPTAATDGRFAAEGDDWNVGFNVGVSWQLGEATRFGAHYRSAIDHEIDGSATTSGLTGPLAPFNRTVGATTSLPLPEIVSIGLAHSRPGSKLTVYADYTWYGWSEFETVRVEFADGSAPVERRPSFRDTYSVAVGLDFRSSDSFAFRAGLKHDRSPTVDGFRDTSFADDDRLWLAVGGTFTRSASFAIDFAVVHVLVDDTEVDVTRDFFTATPLASSVRTRAAVDSTVDTVSVGFRFGF
jgi:long-chain fatty acid transport protein